VAAKVILAVLRVALGALFIYAGAAKVPVAPEFARDIQRYAIIPWPDATVLLAIYLPWLEILSGAAVMVRRFHLGALAVIVALMLAFTAALTSAWTRGLDIECGCFGRKKESIRTNFPALLARDLGVLAAACLLLAAEWRAAKNRVTLSPHESP
jgi:putative oxidoreductase